MMGVHGNGLTSLVWMKPTTRSTVMEFFPEGFAYDYEWTTRALGMDHYGFWGNLYYRPTLDSFPILKFFVQRVYQSGCPAGQLSGRVPGECDTHRWDVGGEDLPRETEPGGRGRRLTQIPLIHMTLN